MQQLLPLTLYQARHGNTGPALYNFRDFLFGDSVGQNAAFPGGSGFGFFRLQLFLKRRQLTEFQLGSFLQFVILLCCFDLSIQILQLFTQLLYIRNGLLFIFPLRFHGIEAIPLFRQLLLQLRKTALGKRILFFLQCRLFNLHLDDLTGDCIQLCRHRVHLRADLGTGLIDQVNGLIRQEAVGDIAVRQGGSSNDGRIRDLHTMKDFIAFLQTSEDCDGVFHRRLIDQHRLETPFQCRILFNILPVFIQCCSANAVQFATGQHRFQ